jgi:hydrogenase small subunit
MWNGHTNFPIGAGHPCIGCTERNFWDTMSPFYTRLPDVNGVGVEHAADTWGAALAIGAVAGVAAHAAATGIHQIQARRKEAAAAGAPGAGEKRNG